MNVMLRFTFTDPEGHTFSDNVNITVTRATFSVHLSARCDPADNAKVLVSLDVASSAGHSIFARNGHYLDGGTQEEFVIAPGMADGTYSVAREYANGCLGVATFEVLGLDYTSPLYVDGDIQNDVLAMDDIAFEGTVNMADNIRVFVKGAVTEPAVECKKLNETIDEGAIYLGGNRHGSSYAATLSVGLHVEFKGLCTFWKGIYVNKGSDLITGGATIGDAEVGVHYSYAKADHALYGVNFKRCLTGVEVEGTLEGLTMVNCTYKPDAAHFLAPYDAARRNEYRSCYGRSEPGFTGFAGVVWPQMESYLRLQDCDFTDGMAGIIVSGSSASNVAVDNTRLGGQFHGALVGGANASFTNGSSFYSLTNACVGQYKGTLTMDGLCQVHVQDNLFIHLSLFET